MRTFSLPNRGAISRWAALLLFTGASLSTVQATTVRRMALPDMVDRSDDVVRARVLENQVRTDPDTRIHWTVTSFQVLDSVKGPLRAGETFDLEVMGGQAEGSIYATIIADAPRFTRDEELVLFTYTTKENRRQPVGFFQGAVRLRSAEEGLMAVGVPPDVLPEAVRPGNTGKAALHAAGTPAPANASPAVGRGRVVAAEKRGAGRPQRGIVPADAFMSRLHAMAADQEVLP